MGAAAPGAQHDAGTPVSDAVLARPLAVPAGVAPWLRGWERRLRDAAAAAEAEAVTRGERVPAFEDALAELHELHPDAERGVFRLLVQRPLWQLAEGSAARETFDRYAMTVLERVDAGVGLLDALMPLRREREALIAEFGALLPTRLAEQLTRARARDEDIARLRRAPDAERMRVRLARARATLERMAAVARDGGFDGSAGRVVAGEPETLAEMFIWLTLERRIRRQLEEHSGALRQHRGRLAAELRGLALAAPTARAAARVGLRAGHTAVVLEHLVAMMSAEAASLEGGDAPLWTGALAAGMAAHHPAPDRFAWLPSLAVDTPDQDERTPAVAEEVHLLHAVPIGGGLVYLSPRGESAIRVRTRSVHLGDVVECQLAPEMVPRSPHALVDRDVAAMFDGLDPSQSRWYATATRAALRVVASHGAGWFARLDHRGVVEALDQPAWHAEGPGSAFRVLRPARVPQRGNANDRAGESHAAAFTSDRAQAAFLGFTLREVRTGLLGDERAWIRGVTGRWRGATDSISAEHALFSALHGPVTGPQASARTDSGGAVITPAVAGLSLRPLGWAATPDSQTPMPLYRIPLATLDGPTHLRNWIVEREEHLLAVIAGVARIIEAAHAAGFALGVCHTEAFAFGIGWTPHPLTPVPTVTLAHAPCATRIGEPYAPPATREMLPSHYRMLRTPVLVPVVAGAQLATPERDMQGFGAFLIDLLLDHPIVERGAIDWYDADRILRERAALATKRHELVKHLSLAVDDPLGWKRLRAVCERAARGLTSVAGLAG
jgi:hypothetical protein